MIRVIRAGERFHLQSDWLSAYWLFSFDRYYDPDNVSFGPLRVFNHDTIRAGAGFPTHSHREMEIVTWVLAGELTHRDSTGGQGVIRPGEVQRMTAGTGVAHSELNESGQEVRLLQIWVHPRQPGLTPSYEQRQFAATERTGRLLPVAAGEDLPGTVRVHQDVTFYVSQLRPGESVRHETGAGRRAFLYVIEGELTVNGESLATGDQARITDEPLLDLTAGQTSEIILLDLP